MQVIWCKKELIENIPMFYLTVFSLFAYIRYAIIRLIR